ncbi:MAG: hypothetical protein EA401_05625 [Planctomycetota bacterium]|nr:MAG: hypothetical protein EA401_05625 [Planctomycetota bacterium]
MSTHNDMTTLSPFAQEVALTLNQRPRQLPTHYLYDNLGSALFDAICHLPWYHLTRAEEGLLKKYGGAICSFCENLGEIIELGPGSGAKMQHLLRGRRHIPNQKPHADNGNDGEPPSLDIHLIDISAAALDEASTRLESCENTLVHCHHCTYQEGLRRIAGETREQPSTHRRLALMLGSNLGNFSPQDSQNLLQDMSRILSPGDYLLLGVDLVKEEDALCLAYNDPLGLTAAFNRNILQRINQELGANFAQNTFAYEVIWNSRAERVESYLVSKVAQEVSIPGANMTIQLKAGEALWTESSYKYRLQGLQDMVAQCSLYARQSWVDEEAQFALFLAEKVT